MACTGFSPESYDLYALGVLQDDEESEIQNHLRAACSTCLQNVRESLERSTRLALAVPQVTPPRRLRARILASVSPNRATLLAWFNSPIAGWAAAALFLAFGIFGMWYGESRTSSPLVVQHVPTPVAPTVTPPFTAPPSISPAPAPVESADLSRKLNDARAALAAQTRATADQQAEDTHVRAELEARSRDFEQQLQAKNTQLASLEQERTALRGKLEAVAATESANTQLRNQLASDHQRLDALTRQVQFYQAAIQSQRADLNRNTTLISLLNAPNLRVLDLQATENGGAAYGRALVTANASILFYASKLPPLPPGRTYQLWIMRDRGRSVTSGGIFAPDSNQSAIVTAPGAIGITALAVTEEPAGGQPLPTGHKILIGTSRG